MKGRSFSTLACKLLAIPLVMLSSGGGRPAYSQFRGLGDLKGTITINKNEDRSMDHEMNALVNRYVADPAGAELLVDPSEKRPYTLSEKTVVYLEMGEAGKYPVPTTHRSLEQKGLKFHPEVLPILVGATVDFPNGDNLFHNVFSYSQTKEFDLGRYPMGDSRSVVFARPGIVRVYCDIHSHMNATILVLENPYFASPDNDGTFSIADIPEGKYRLCLWYGRDVVLHRSITIKEGETTMVTLTY